MNYVDILGLLKGNNNYNLYADDKWDYYDKEIDKSISDTINSIWHSDERNEIEVKEEKKNDKTECQHPDDGCIYW